MTERPVTLIRDDWSPEPMTPGQAERVRAWYAKCVAEGRITERRADDGTTFITERP